MLVVVAVEPADGGADHVNRLDIFGAEAGLTWLTEEDGSDEFEGCDAGGAIAPEGVSVRRFFCVTFFVMELPACSRDVGVFGEEGLEVRHLGRSVDLFEAGLCPTRGGIFFAGFCEALIGSESEVWCLGADGPDPGVGVDEFGDSGEESSAFMADPAWCDGGLADELEDGVRIGKVGSVWQAAAACRGWLWCLP